MDDFVLSVYLKQLVEFIDDALRALGDVEASLDNNIVPIVFAELDRFLVQAARVSRFVWPGAPGGATKLERNQRQSRSDKRSKVLRDTLGITGKSVLNDRTLRDHLEHLDERLDDWVSNSVSVNFADCNIGPFDFVDVGCPEDSFRHYDPDEQKFKFRGETFDLAAIRDELKKVREEALKKLKAISP